MALIDEAAGIQGQMASALASGLDTLDLDQSVTFTAYTRMVLPVDGFVFWVRAQPVASFDAPGSLHHTSINQQNPDENLSVHRMIFTSKVPVNDLAAIAPDRLYLAQTHGQRYAFSTRSMWYRQAMLYHYAGDAVYPALALQIIDDPAALDLANRVVSNSLPIWLALASPFPLYPAMLVPDNLPPPYGVVEITADSTEPMMAGALYDATGSRWQLVRETVVITTYGVRNDMMMDWLDMVQAYARNNPATMGIMNSPVPRDVRRGQVEISALAQKKTVTFHVNYYQTRMRDVAQQFITSALIANFLQVSI